MIGDTFKHFFRNCCSNLKAYVLTRHERVNARKWNSDCADCDFLSDRNTFFAWQRNHMANERTFLAWCRTGISLIVFAFVIERFDLLIRYLHIPSEHPVASAPITRHHYLSLITFGLGAFIIILAGWRFFYIRKHINKVERDFSVLPDVFLMSSILITNVMLFLFLLYIY